MFHIVAICADVLQLFGNVVVQRCGRAPFCESQGSRGFSLQIVSWGVICFSVVLGSICWRREGHTCVRFICCNANSLYRFIFIPDTHQSGYGAGLQFRNTIDGKQPYALRRCPWWFVCMCSEGVVCRSVSFGHDGACCRNEGGNHLRVVGACGAAFSSDLFLYSLFAGVGSCRGSVGCFLAAAAH